MPLNKPMPITDVQSCDKSSREKVNTSTRIAGKSITVVVRIEQGETKEETSADIISGLTIQDGGKTGIQPLPAAQNSVAVKPCI